MIDWLDNHKDDFGNGDVTVYPLDKARARYEVRDLGHEGHLVLKWDEQKLWLHFAVMTFYCSDGDGKNVMLVPAFYGEGPSANLRECRHTYWGEDGNGYLFYPDGRVIAAAFKALSEFFDEMA